MSAIDFFHLTDACLDWEKQGDDIAVLEPLVTLLAAWGDDLNDIVSGRRKLKGSLLFESILSVPAFAWARVHGKQRAL